MARKQIEVRETERDALREFKDTHGWSYSEAVRRLLDAWPGDEAQKAGVTDGGDELAATVAELEETVEYLKDRQSTIVENQNALHDELNR